jgi:DNA polymerase-3 subunit epsilon
MTKNLFSVPDALENPESSDQLVELEDLAKRLEAHPDFKVLRRLIPHKTFHTNPPERVLSKGVILDTETTGMDVQKDKVIELGMILFEFDPQTGIIYKVLKTFDEYEDPGFPIPAESTAVHNITDEMVKGCVIADDEVKQFLKNVSVVIAHNAGFDRAFVEMRWPIFADYMWACSLKDIDWRGEGFGSAKLEYLVYTQGLFYEAHRADADCCALLELLSCTLPNSQQPALLQLLESLNQPQIRLFALGSPFETKETLKQRNYRWSADLRSWHRTLTSEKELEAELSWLKRNIYENRKAVVEVERIGGKVRYSQRTGEKIQVPL